MAFFDDGNGTVARVAFAVNRKVGMAVARNRIRRRLREIARRADLRPGAWLITASPAAADAGFTTLAGWFTDAVAAVAA